MPQQWRRRERVDERKPSPSRVPRRGALSLLGIATCFLWATAAAGQQPNLGSALPNPRLTTVMPAGGQLGKVVEVTFTGTDLEDPEALLFSHPGFKAEPVKSPAPPGDPKKAPPKIPPPLPPITKFKVTIAPDTPLGIHDVRFVGKWGVSNPRAFVVGDLAEVLEKEPNNEVEQAQRVELNTTVNGVVSTPTDVDYFVFAGKKGQRVVVSCLASSVDSRLQPGLELYDKAGRLLAFNRLYNGTDALVDLTLPEDGDYWVRLCEFTYLLGNAEYFYRLSISTAPWIDAIYPPMVEPGKTARLTVYGRNLPGGQPDPTAVVDGRFLEKLVVSVNPSADPAALQRLAYLGHVPPAAAELDGFEYRLRNASGVSNPYLLTYARAPVILEKEAHDTPETAQEVTVPCEIAGRVEKKRDRDWYSFNAKKGETYWIDVLSARLGAPTDMYYLVRNPANKGVITEQDDNPDILHRFKFFTRHEDPGPFRFAAPADGKYQLLVASRDADLRAGPRQLYRVRITPDQPDFRLFVMPPDDFRPDSGQLFKGGEQFFTVMAWRFEGFNGPITVSAEGLPPGVTCPPQVMAPNLRQVPLVISAAPTAAPGVFDLKAKGTATVNGQPVVREARPATITWAVPPQQGIPAVSRLDRAALVAVREQAPFRVTAALGKATVLQGEKPNLTLKLARLWPDFKGQVQLIAMDLPPNLLTVNNNQPVTIPAGKDDAKVPVDAKPTLPPGTYTIALRATTQIAYNKDPMAKQKPNINVVLPSTAVALTVLPKQVATLALANPNLTAKIGNQAELVVKVTRMYDYTGEFKVAVVLPPNAKGVSVDEVTIPAGQSEAKVVLRVAAGVQPANLANLVVRATALVNGNLPTVHEAKFNVNVIK